MGIRRTFGVVVVLPSLVLACGNATLDGTGETSSSTSSSGSSSSGSSTSSSGNASSSGGGNGSSSSSSSSGKPPPVDPSTFNPLCKINVAEKPVCPAGEAPCPASLLWDYDVKCGTFEDSFALAVGKDDEGIVYGSRTGRPAMSFDDYEDEWLMRVKPSAPSAPTSTLLVRHFPPKAERDGSFATMTVDASGAIHLLRGDLDSTAGVNKTLVVSERVIDAATGALSAPVPVITTTDDKGGLSPRTRLWSGIASDGSVHAVSEHFYQTNTIARAPSATAWAMPEPATKRTEIAAVVQPNGVLARFVDAQASTSVPEEVQLVRPGASPITVHVAITQHVSVSRLRAALYAGAPMALFKIYGFGGGPLEEHWLAWEGGSKSFEGISICNGPNTGCGCSGSCAESGSESMPDADIVTTSGSNPKTYVVYWRSTINRTRTWKSVTHSNFPLPGTSCRCESSLGTTTRGPIELIIAEVGAGGTLTPRFTHVYPDTTRETAPTVIARAGEHTIHVLANRGTTRRWLAFDTNLF